jgi:hypothetical protein
LVSTIPRKWRSDIAGNESNLWHGPLAGYTMGKSAQVLLGMPLENHWRFLADNSSYVMPPSMTTFPPGFLLKYQHGTPP